MTRYTMAVGLILMALASGAYAAEATTVATPHHVTRAVLTQPVNINTADIKHLSQLRGIGKKRAQAIVEYRKAHGNFHTMAELGQVKGFTKKFLTRLQQQNPDLIQF